MMDAYDPARVHEFLAILMLVLLVPTAAVAFAYIRALGAFFNELKQREPDVWRTVGTPGLFGMLTLPFFRFRKYSSFLPVLRERVARQGDGYRHAGRTYLLLKVGLSLTVVLFILGGIIVFWMVYHDL
jgi:hypothetical protein